MVWQDKYSTKKVCVLFWAPLQQFESLCQPNPLSWSLKSGVVTQNSLGYHDSSILIHICNKVSISNL